MHGGGGGDGGSGGGAGGGDGGDDGEAYSTVNVHSAPVAHSPVGSKASTRHLIAPPRVRSPAGGVADVGVAIELADEGEGAAVVGGGVHLARRRAEGAEEHEVGVDLHARRAVGRHRVDGRHSLRPAIQ